ncbi:MAG: DUF1501 domain-containing protein [Nannocystales bacterium]
MDRRSFIKLASLTGLSVVAPTAFAGDIGSSQRPSLEPYTGPLLLSFQASGGWETRFHCNPKIMLSPNEGNPRSHVTGTEKIGEIEFAAEWPDEYFGGRGTEITEFYRKHAQRMTVINGIDQMTNGHDEGRTHTATGTLNMGHPTLGALMAGTYDPSLPMAYLAFGGVTETAGVVARTRANNIDVLARVAYPELADPNNPDSTYQPQPVLDMISAAQQERDVAVLEQQGLPRFRTSVNRLHSARSGSDELRKLQDYLPENVEGGILGQIQVALAAYQAGLCVSAELSMGGFDTHGNSDTAAVTRLTQLYAALDFAYETATELGIMDKVIMTAGSDFSRTLGYNGGMGADHWPVGSVIAMGAGVPENRSVGASDDNDRALGINPDLTVNTTNTIRKVTPADVHHTLRKAVGVGSGEIASMFPLSASDEPLDLFA